MFERSLLLLWVAGALVVAACGDESNNGDGSEASGGTGGASGAPGEPAAPAADCPERCAEKAASCGAPADLALSECGSICGAMLSEEELECLEEEDCAALEQALFGSGGACNLGGGSSASGGSASGGSASGGSASGGSASGGNPNAQIGDDCSCSGADVAFESCSGTGSSCGELTCYVVFGEGICSQTCTADINGDDCPAGECTEHLVNGVTVGVWCAP